MPNPSFRALLACAALLGGLSPLSAQTAPDGAASLVGPVQSVAVLEPEAAQALDRMGAYLRNLNRFEVTSDANVDILFSGDQKLQFAQRTTYLVQAPRWMRVDIRTDRQHRRIYYDGQTITFAGQKSQKYLSLPQTGTIAEVLTQASDRFGIEFPLQDLFRWGDPSSNVEPPKSGFRVGDSEVDGQPAGHYAFRQDGADFQLWIGKDKPLPLRMVVTNTENPAQPQFSTVFRWNMEPRFGSTDFSFKPESGWQAIDLKALKDGAR
ncbi:DUF2092 domain-containing protein [Sandaracinobacter sp. RS1-74]|uniref:DUF2092 domain-containing protein n=1 Tax=Sandaracinobacteroides sayramensis TaxID=2913411 RepID=UPI001EDBB598|nr:DUF2092 domain-containing protein [Sandaracinobacteroides sayramensis]MCG2841601.1 DUF2092 domain-containing protein [Sandaracinobacteroides sayramensis]